MSNEVAEIHKKGHLAGHLTKKGNSLVFTYQEKYLTSGGPAIATTLPLSPEPITLPGSTSPAFFSGLLPEGRRLNAVAARLKTSLSNDLALLLEFGQDLVGDVQVLPEDGNPEKDRETLILSPATEELNFNDIRDEYFGSKSSGIPGVQDKVSSNMLSTRANVSNIDYILKFNPDDLPLAVENEAHFLALAKKCDIPVSNYRLMTDKFGNHALRLQRFDRILKPQGKVRLAAEDGCQVMNHYPSEKYDIDFVEMALELISHCPARGVAGYALFKQLVFNWLIGNGNAHAKNFSILQSESGEWMISPAYDLLCTAFYNNATQMALPIDGKKTGWDRAFLINIAKKLYVPAKIAETVIDKQLKILEQLPETVRDDALPYRRDQKNDAHNLLKKRRNSLLD